MKKLKHSSLNNISHVLPILSTSEKKRTSRGRPQPFKTMFYRLRRETKNSNIPTLKNIEQEDTQGTTGCFLSCGIQRRKVSLDDLLSFTATLKFSCFLYILYILQQNPGNSNSEGKPKTVGLSRSIEQSISCVNKEQLMILSTQVYSTI